jgi:hypothetical protein
MKTKRFFLFGLTAVLLAVSASLTLGLAGCGGEDEKDPGSTAGPESGGDSGKNPGSTGTGTGTTPAVVTDLDLTDKVYAPVAGAAPVPSVWMSQYTGTVEWSGTGGGSVVNSSIFQSGTAYTDTARLTANSGYAFAGTPVFAHTGAASVPKTTRVSTTTFYVTIDFPGTETVMESVVIKPFFGSLRDDNLPAGSPLLVYWNPSMEDIKALGGFTVDYAAVKPGTITGTEVLDAKKDLKLDLPAGDYKFTVGAYPGYDDTSTPNTKKVTGNQIAYSSATQATTGGDVNIYLYPIASSATGTFKWNITLPTSPSTAQLDKFTYQYLEETGPAASTMVTITDPNMLKGPNASASLPSGSYFVTVSLKNNTGAYMGLVHIYAGLETLMELTADFFPMDNL